LVHLNPIATRSPGLRYVTMDSELQEQFRHGSCLSLKWSRLDKRNGFPVLTTEHVKRDEKLEFGLRKAISATLNETNPLPEENGAHESYLPLGSSESDLCNRERCSNCNGISEDMPAWARIHVHNVGQGDTIVLELPGGQVWIIDAMLWSKPRRDEFNAWMTKKGFHDKVKKVVISHFHYDHIHSIPYVIETYNPQEVIISEALNHPTGAVQRVLDSSGGRLKKLGRKTAVYYFGNLKMRLIPSLALYDKNVSLPLDPNYHGVGILVETFSSFAFLGGDMPLEQCVKICSEFKSDTAVCYYYKVSHHGSRTACDDKFPSSLYPCYSVISCGYRNRYGHPHDPVLSALRHGRCVKTYNISKGNTDSWTMFNTE